MCFSGYVGDGFSCYDADECLDNPCHHGECTNKIGSFECSCHSGYEKDAVISNICRDIDECSNNLNFCKDHECKNFDGSHTCNCKLRIKIKY